MFASAQISSSPTTGHDLPQPGDPTFDSAIAFLTGESPSSRPPLQSPSSKPPPPPGKNGDWTAQDKSGSPRKGKGKLDESDESVSDLSETSAARGPQSERGTLPWLIATAVAVRLLRARAPSADEQKSLLVVSLLCSAGSLTHRRSVVCALPRP